MHGRLRQHLNVAVLWLLSPDGKSVRPGGMERWCLDFARLAFSKGLAVTIYQKAFEPFEKTFDRGLRVVGIRAPLSFLGNFVFAARLRKLLQDPDIPIVFISQELCLSKYFRRAVAVNHGIWWDGDYPSWNKLLIKRLHLRILLTCKGVICVDTNYINWCHTELPNRKQWRERLVYVPNYADLALFKVDRRRPSNRIRLLYPRRLDGTSLEEDGRGIHLMLQAFLLLLERGLDVELVCCGPGPLSNAALEWAKQRGCCDRIHLTHVGMDEMPEIYKSADIIVVPSTGHEGTAMAAVEGLVSGKPTVVSHLGGLANVVIDGVNGYICDLTPTSLADAVVRAMECGPPEEAVLDAVRKSLSKERWEAQVWEHVKRFLAL